MNQRFRDNKKKYNQNNDYLKDLDEWSENRYNPGYYIGTGRIPPFLKYARKPIGILLLLSGCFVLIGCEVAIYSSGFSALLLVDFFYGTLLLVAGVLVLTRRKNEDRNQKAHSKNKSD